MRFETHCKPLAVRILQVGPSGYLQYLCQWNGGKVIRLR